MIHAYLGFAKVPHKDDERIVTLEPTINFFGKKDAIEYWKNELKKAQKSFPKIDWFEKDPAKRQEQIQAMFKCFIQFFAEKEFKPAGDVNGERVFYFDAK